MIRTRILFSQQLQIFKMIKVKGMKHIYYLVIILIVGVMFVACYDKDNTIHRIPDLVIENVTGGSVKTGELIEITPKCIMGGEEVECTYNWYRYRDTAGVDFRGYSLGMESRYRRFRDIGVGGNSC